MAVRKPIVAAVATAIAATVIPLTASPAAAVPPDPPTPRGIQEFCQKVSDDYQPFSDIEGNAFSFNIRCLAAAEITRGAPGNMRADQHGPGLRVRRDAMASFIARLIDAAGELDRGDSIRDLPAFDGEVNVTDVSPSSVHAWSIDRLVEAGIVQGGLGGRPSNEYGPSDDVTRAQMASLLRAAVEFMTAEEVGSSQQDYFTDDENAVPHEPRIDAVASLAIAVGDGGDTYNPFLPVPRAQMSALLSRSLTFLAERGDIAPLPLQDIHVSPDTEATFNAEPNPDSGTAVFIADGTTAMFVVDGDESGESVRPVLYRNGGGNNGPKQGGADPRLELYEDRTSVEPLGLGGVVTFASPVSLNVVAAACVCDVAARHS